MKPEEFYELYQLICEGTAELPTRKQAMQLRKVGLQAHLSGQSFIKVAFDTRRVDQETAYIPRRGLQNYHRSESFISDSVADKILAFAKLAKILDQLKLEFGRHPEWQDSYTRVLASSVHKGLRTDELDGDYSDSQPSMASL